MYRHIFSLKSREQAQEALGLQITCTNMLASHEGTPTISFQTDYPLGSITLIALKQETQTVKVEANSPLAGTPSPMYSVSLAQMLLTGVAGIVFFGLAWLTSASIAGVIGATVATGVITICSNDLLPIRRRLRRREKPLGGVLDEGEPAHV